MHIMDLLLQILQNLMMIVECKCIEELANKQKMCPIFSYRKYYTFTNASLSVCFDHICFKSLTEIYIVS